MTWLQDGINFIYNNHIETMCTAEGIYIIENKKIFQLKNYMLLGKTKKIFPELNEYMLSSPCGKLYKADMIKKEMFNVNCFFCEDWLFIFNIISKCNRIGFSSNIWYNYYQYEESTIHSVKKEIIDNNITLIRESIGINTKLKYSEEETFFVVEKIGEIFRHYIKCKQVEKKYIKNILVGRINYYIDFKKMIILKNKYMNLNQKIRGILIYNKLWNSAIFYEKIITFIKKILKKEKKLIG